MANKRLRICGIYKITAPNGLIYIGQSRDILKRFISHKNLSNHGTPVCESIRIHGSEAHQFEVLEECEPEILDMMECKYIDLLNSSDPKYGLNRRSGGIYGKFCEDTKQKMKLAAKQRLINQGGISQKLIDASRKANLGSKRTEDTKRKMADSQKKWVINTITGEEYFGLQKAADAIGMKEYSLRARLQGKYKNRTNLIYKK